MHREQRTARVSESADTDEPQKKQSIVTFVPDFRLAIGNLHKSYTLSIPLWRSVVNNVFIKVIYYKVLISLDLIPLGFPLAYSGSPHLYCQVRFPQYLTYLLLYGPPAIS